MGIITCGVCGKPIGGRDLNTHYATDCEMPTVVNLHTRIRDLEKRIEDAVTAEREACAAIVDESVATTREMGYIEVSEGLEDLAAAIRARGSCSLGRE